MQRSDAVPIGGIGIGSLLKQTVNAETGAFPGRPMQGGPSLWIGRIDSVLNSPRVPRVCSETLAAVVGSGFLLVFPAPSILVRAVKVLDGDAARMVLRLQVGPGFDQPVHHVRPPGGIGPMQWGPPLVVARVRIGRMFEKRLRALGPTFLDRSMQWRGPVPVAVIEGSPGRDQTAYYCVASGLHGVVQRRGPGLVPRMHIGPGLDQEAAAGRGGVVGGPMQRGRTRIVPGVHVGPGVNQGPVNIEVGIPDGRAMQRRLAPPIPQRSDQPPDR